MRPANQPDAEYFAVMAHNAANHWWYRARRAMFHALLDGRVPPGGTALDVGCGTGETIGVLRELGARRVAGTDLSDDALGYARSRGSQGSILAALAEELPFPDGCADVVVSSDVLEHLDDDRLALREYRRVMRDGATLLVTVPSYRWLWCHLDNRAGHRRRYVVDELADKVAEAGFAVDHRTYYFSFLLPAAAMIRRTPLGRFTPDTDEDASGGKLVSWVLAHLSNLERKVLVSKRVPFGLSQLVLATAVPLGMDSPGRDAGDAVIATTSPAIS